MPAKAHRAGPPAKEDEYQAVRSIDFTAKNASRVGHFQHQRTDSWNVVRRISIGLRFCALGHAGTVNAFFCDVALATCFAARVERRRPFPGDAIVPKPMFQFTHAITIGEAVCWEHSLESLVNANHGLSKKDTMTAIEAFVTRHPVRTYFALAFAISWAGVLFVVGPDGIPTTIEHLITIGPAMFVAMLAGPSVAGLLMTSLVSGRAGLREVLARLLTWRVGGRWYAVALLTAPFLVMAVSLALSLLSPEFLPAVFMTNDKAPVLLSGLAAGLIVGIFEELGWTGFAIPRMRRRYGVLSTGLLVGVLWGAWHFLMFWEPGSFSGAFPLALLLVKLFSWLPAYRVLMVWVYDRTGSLLVAMLMHGSLTATQLILMPLPASGMSLLTSILAWAAALWIVVASDRRGQPLADLAATAP